jgi:signal transduction histidine kinase
MAQAAEAVRASKQTTLQRTLTTALNELGLDPSLVAIVDQAPGPLVAHGVRGFTPRDVQAILRALSAQEVGFLDPPAGSGDSDGSRSIRLRMIIPGSKSLLAVALRHKQRVYGVLVMGRKDNAAFSKKEKSLVENASDTISAALERANLFDNSVILGRPFVTTEPAPPPAPVSTETFSQPASMATPNTQARITELFDEAAPTIPFDRAWATFYDPLVGSIEVVGLAGAETKTEAKPEHRKDLKPGVRLALDASASGWAVRHRKTRVDHDLASTQGRFLDHKHLYKDRFKSCLVVPFFVRGQVGGTVTLASRAADQYTVQDSRLLEPLIAKLVDLQEAPVRLAAPKSEVESSEDSPAPAQPAASPEPLIRKQERQAALGEFSAFLATEIREPLASIRAQLDEVTSEGILDFDPQTRIENAMRDLIRIEAILSEILDFTKPLELNRRLCRVPEIIENTLTVVATELDMNRIQVTKDYAAHLNPVRCDESKMQQVFLSIFKNSLEAMRPGGNLHVEVTPHRSGRHHDVQILMKNDGEPIPTEHVGKVFEPFFTTKRAGTGLGLATVKKIVEEHQGQISIASGPGQGTTVIIKLPAQVRTPYRHRGRGRRPQRPRQ